LTHLATALCYEALDKGYAVSFVTLDEFMRQLKTADISAASKRRLNYHKKAQLIVIDEVITTVGSLRTILVVGYK
jgi:DNA replication protein DnaC